MPVAHNSDRIIVSSKNSDEELPDRAFSTALSTSVLTGSGRMSEASCVPNRVMLRMSSLMIGTENSQSGFFR